MSGEKVFADGFRMRSIDLLLVNVVLTRSSPVPPGTSRRFWPYAHRGVKRETPTIGVVVVVVVVGRSIGPPRKTNDSESIIIYVWP